MWNTLWAGGLEVGGLARKALWVFFFTCQNISDPYLPQKKKKGFSVLIQESNNLLGKMKCRTCCWKVCHPRQNFQLLSTCRSQTAKGIRGALLSMNPMFLRWKHGERNVKISNIIVLTEEESITWKRVSGLKLRGGCCLLMTDCSLCSKMNRPQD